MNRQSAWQQHLGHDAVHVPGIPTARQPRLHLPILRGLCVTTVCGQSGLGPRQGRLACIDVLTAGARARQNTRDHARDGDDAGVGKQSGENFRRSQARHAMILGAVARSPHVGMSRWPRCGRVKQKVWRNVAHFVACWYEAALLLMVDSRSARSIRFWCSGECFPGASVNVHRIRC